MVVHAGTAHGNKKVAALITLQLHMHLPPDTLLWSYRVPEKTHCPRGAGVGAGAPFTRLVRCNRGYQAENSRSQNARSPPCLPPREDTGTSGDMLRAKQKVSGRAGT